MLKTNLNRKKTTYFSDLANELVYNQADLKEFITPILDIHSFKQQIALKQAKYTEETRSILVSTLKEQYSATKNTDKIRSQLDLLEKSTTFTVTTGHQLSLFTGPLFFIYKIIHAINLSKALKKAYPSYDFVPVYWMASEDHDFEEINHLYLFGEKIEWTTAQSGAVGSFHLNDFSAVKNALLGKFERDEAIKSLIERHYVAGDSLSKATFNFVHELFQDEGLVIIEPNNSALKRTFTSYIEKEINDSFSEKAVKEQNKKLEERGYGLQVFPREINLFYLLDDQRERIIKEGPQTFRIGDILKTREEIGQELIEKPELFSPNVVLRPLYQEVLLPNICYVGGGGEIAYWTQLKKVFESVSMPFPLLMVRNSVLLVDKGTQKKIKKLGLQIVDFFGDIHQLKKQYVLDHPESSLDFDTLDQTAESLVRDMEKLILEVDPKMSSYAKSESVRLKKQLDQVKTKMIRHQKKLMEDVMRQIDTIFDKLFPNAGLQERYDNFLQWESISNGGFIQSLLEKMDPFEKDLIILDME